MTRAQHGMVVVVCFAVVSAGCAASRDILVHVETHKPQAYDARQIEVQAMVVGPQTGLHYKWFSVNGDFDPQESYEPKTQFTFAANAARDRIWVAVWRDYEKVAEGGLYVDVGARRTSAKAKNPAPEITVTRVPHYQPG